MFAGLLVGCAFHSGPALPAGLSRGGFVPCCWELCLHWGSPCLPTLCFCCPWQVCSSLICVSLFCNPCWWMRSSAGQSWSCPDQFQMHAALSLLWVWHLNLQKGDTLKMSLVMRCWLKASVVDAAKRPERAILGKYYFIAQICTLLGKEVVPHLHGGTCGVLVLSEPGLQGRTGERGINLFNISVLPLLVWTVCSGSEPFWKGTVSPCIFLFVFLMVLGETVGL